MVMKVYIVSVVIKDYEYAKQYTYGVYKEKAKAEKVKGDLIKEHSYHDCFKSYIEEFEVK
jgi:hypothetical protein